MEGSSPLLFFAGELSLSRRADGYYWRFLRDSHDDKKIKEE
jgi:hypothetical protein